MYAMPIASDVFLCSAFMGCYPAVQGFLKLGNGHCAGPELVQVVGQDDKQPAVAVGIRAL